ncbi:Plexin-D1 [Goodea atripinnis]|uniref:Plexin-D1 n=1 Tax=Goodea atripinnis TaxID=208336 RepID=A0ABV0P7S3_9TELE
MKLPAGEAVHHVMTFDPNDRNFLYIMTSHHMLRVKVAECDQWKSCTDCLGAGDAYCGWCTLENRALPWLSGSLRVGVTGRERPARNDLAEVEL